jgi:predicted dehydrogenase
MAESIGIAVLGYAHGHVTAYTDRIKGFDDARIVACWDHDAARARSQAERFGLDWSTDMAAVLGRDDVQAVVIGAETNRHATCAIAAAEAGKDIVIQKPLAISLADCDAIIEAVDRAGVRAMVAYQMRCDPLNIKLRELVKEGAVGRVGYIRRRHCIPVLFDPNFAGTWHVSAEANRGMYADDACHAADFLNWILGTPVTVMAEIDNVLTNVAPDDTGVAVYRWADGCMGTLMSASVTLAGENTTEVYGDQGVLIQNHDDAVSTHNRLPGAIGLKLYRRSTGVFEVIDVPLPASHGERISGVARPLVDWLHGRREAITPLREARQASAMILAAYDSAASGRRVSIEA